MAKVYYIQKEVDIINNCSEGTHLRTTNRDYFEYEFNRLKNIPDTREIVKGHWLRNDRLGIEYWKEIMEE